jgi:hypothetical protein
MKLIKRWWQIPLLSLFLSLAVFIFPLDNFKNKVSQDGALPLVPPPFIVHAASSTTASGLADEAGIAAYFQATGSINLTSNQLRNLFRTIETSTSDYLIGFIYVPNYGETEDVKVYIHHDGWVMAYYLKRDPASKIFDYNSTNTRLEAILSLIANAVGDPPPTAQFYDFRYPNATHLLLVGEQRSNVSGTDSFEVTIPTSYIVDERSWYLGGSITTVRFILDGVTLGQTMGNPAYGYIPANQFVPDAVHIIGINNLNTYFDDCFGGLAIIYREIP